MIYPFVEITVPLRNQKQGEDGDFTKSLAILEKRLPKSCFIYNAVKIAPRFPLHSKLFYVNPPTVVGVGVNLTNGNSSTDPGISETSWIILTHFTEDHGQNILISAPLRTDPYSPEEAKNLQKLFANCPTSILNWSEPHWFVALDLQESRLMTEISLELKGHSIEIYPDILVYMEKDDPDLIPRLEQDLAEIAKLHPSLEIKALDPIHGTEFISSTWKLASRDSSLPVRRFLEINESGGVYSGNAPISGILLHGWGFLSMLYTSESERGKGFAKMGIKLASLEMLKNGLYPVSSIDAWNTPSLAAHTKLGFKVGGGVHWIMWKPSEEEKKLLEG